MTPHRYWPVAALAMDPRLTADLLGEKQWRRLNGIVQVPDRSPILDFHANALHHLGLVEVLLTGWGCPRVDGRTLHLMPRLRLIAHTGSSVKPIVTDELWHRGILVSSAAAANAIPVAEFALAAILFANKGVFRSREETRRLRGFKSHPWVAPGSDGNLGAVVGIVGFSRTGRRLVQLLASFDLDVLVYDPIAKPAEIAALGARQASLQELFDQAGVVSLHAPSLPETHGLVSGSMLARLRDGATIINTARGDLIDQDALERELVSGRLFAVLDVTRPEPPPASSPLYELSNVFLTPHMAGAAGRETKRLADLAIDEISRFIAGEPLAHQVTPQMLQSIG
ncbi:hydroxyacid dehydrogenase [Mesorhizobium sp. AD1-1]|uniref:hydroxyacid dehydrogenase n=1 Tax=Mesorhizobium sp. AD1-1 TaxID=2876621 RepID=UPI001CCC657E|nr:hydroxyacid dehydrogenase [Mesorhizobium sp. AD1-1]MBZ9719238.1 hydroxyacid dehydrogenase [Mesorhizobium sp. AD1-1]